MLGRVTMDQILADVTALPQVEAGDEAVLIGRQGNAEIFVAELAEKSGTIPWEIFTGIGRAWSGYTKNNAKAPGRLRRQRRWVHEKHEKARKAGNPFVYFAYFVVPPLFRRKRRWETTK